MNRKNAFVAIFVMGVLLGCKGLFGSNRSLRIKLPSAAFVKTVAGYNVRLVAVVNSGITGGERLADHAWTPDGFPFEGPEARLQRNVTSAERGGSGYSVFFEIEPSKEAIQTNASPNLNKTVDVFSYLPKNGLAERDATDNPNVAGPIEVQIWQGRLLDSAGNHLRAAPGSVAMGFGSQNTDTQPVVFGIAQGEFKIIAKGPASVVGLQEGQSAIIASGPWGKIEATHLVHPMAESKPSPTHRFRLLGGAFPPATERKVYFYDAKGNVIASCGDGVANPGYAGLPYFTRTASLDIARYEVGERPYDFVQFDRVSFDAPQFNAYSGTQGLDHEVDSPIGKVVGILKTKADGNWSGSILYAADGTRWIDAESDLVGYENGQFDPWSRPATEGCGILFEPNDEGLSSTTPTTCDVYAADSPDGPNKEKLTMFNEMPFRTPMTEIPCKPTTRPYMRVELRPGNGTWRTLDTVPVNGGMLKTAESGSPGARVLSVFFDDEGSIRIWKDEADPVRSKSHWRKGEQRFRVIAHLRNGRTADADLNMSGYGGVPPNERGYRGVEYTRQLDGTHVQSGRTSIDFKDIASFDLQLQDLRPAITIPVHSPVD